MLGAMEILRCVALSICCPLGPPDLHLLEVQACMLLMHCRTAILLAALVVVVRADSIGVVLFSNPANRRGGARTFPIWPGYDSGPINAYAPAHSTNPSGRMDISGPHSLVSHDGTTVCTVTQYLGGECLTNTQMCSCICQWH